MPSPRCCTRAASRIILFTAALFAAAAPALAQPDGPGGRGDRRGEGRGDGPGGGPGGGFRGDFGFGRGMGGPGMGGMRQLMGPEFVRRDARLITEELELERDQITILETLLLDYEAAFAEASESMRDRFRALRPELQLSEAEREQRRTLFEEMGQIRREMREIREQAGQDLDPQTIETFRARLEPLREKIEAIGPVFPEGEELQALADQTAALAKEWKNLRGELRSDLLGGLRAILNEEQAALWPTFERTLRRHKGLGRGRLSGESIDLLLLLRMLDLEEPQRPDESLVEGYSSALDAAIVARDEYLDRERLEVFRLMAAGEVDEAVARVAREGELRVNVRGVNEQFLEAFAAAIEMKAAPESSAELRQRYREQAFERIFGPTSTQRSFAVAREMEGLAEDSMLAILALEESYAVELKDMNERLVKLTREREPLEEQERMRARAERRREREIERLDRPERPEDPLRELFRERNQLNQRYREQIEGYLTPDQIASLPALERRGEGRGRGGPDGEGRGGPGGEERRARMLEQFDRDGNGELSDEERDAMRQARRQREGGGEGGN